MILREYLPIKWAGILGASFYLGISIGTNIGFLYQQSWMADYYYIILWIPGFFALVMLLSFLIFFNVESPRVIFIELSAKLLKKNSDHQKEETDDDKKEIPQNENQTESNKYLTPPNNKYDLEGRKNTLRSEQTSQFTYFPEESLDTGLLTRDNSTQNLYQAYIKDSRILAFAKKFYSTKDIPLFLRFSFDELNNAINQTESPGSKSLEAKLGPLKLAFHRKYRKQFFIVILLNVLNQLTGINCLVMYSTDIFVAIGYTDLAKIISIILGLCNFAGAIFSPTVINKLGRKVLISSGLALQVVCYILIMAGDVFNIPIIIVIAFCVFMFAFAISAGGVIYVYSAEIVPAKLLAIPMLVAAVLDRKSVV